MGDENEQKNNPIGKILEKAKKSITLVFIPWPHV